MNLERARVVLRPRTQSELLDLAARFCVGLGRGLYLRLAALVLLPCLGLTFLAWYLTDGHWPLVWLTAWLLAALAEGVFTVAASRLLFEAQPGVAAVLGLFLRRSAAYGLALLLVGIMVVAGSVMVVLGLLAWVVYTFLPEAVLLEGMDPPRCLGRARVLIARRFSAALGLRLAATVAQLFAVFAADALLGAGLVDFVLQLGSPLGSLIDDGGSAFAVLGLFVAAPYVATARFLSYIDGRTRQDGWDIQLRFTAIASAEAGARAATEVAA